MTCRHAPGYHDNDRYEPPSAPATPSPTNYEIVEVIRVGAHLVIKILYPNCRACSYEGE